MRTIRPTALLTPRSQRRLDAAERLAVAVATGQRDSQQAIGDPATAETITTRCLLSHRYEGDRLPVAADEGELQCARVASDRRRAGERLALLEFPLDRKPASTAATPMPWPGSAARNSSSSAGIPRRKAVAAWPRSCARKIAGHGFPKVGQVTASFGVAACRDGDSAATLLARADAALYRAKAGGRNRTSPSTASPRSPPSRPLKAPAWGQISSARWNAAELIESINLGLRDRQ